MNRWQALRQPGEVIQYRLELLAKAHKKGGLLPVKVKTGDHKIKIVAAPKVWMPGDAE